MEELSGALEQTLFKCQGYSQLDTDAEFVSQHEIDVVKSPAGLLAQTLSEISRLWRSTSLKAFGFGRFKLSFLVPSDLT